MLTGPVGITGASTGANVAILEAASDATSKSVVLLSPGLDYRSLNTDAAMRKYETRHALLVVATSDPYAVRSANKSAALGGDRREIKTLDSAGHVTTRLERDAELGRVLVDWFQHTLL